MKKNVNVFIGVVLCAVLCGVFVWLSTASEEDTWKPNEIYNEVHAAGPYSSSYTTANFSAPSTNGGVALTLSSSPMMRHSGASFYAGASYAPAASSPLALSPMGGASGAGLYTTSSAELKSFGGGGNGGAAMGGASSAASRSVSTGQSFGGLAVASSPISYSTGRRGGMNTSDANTAMMAEDPALAVASAAGLSYGYSAFDNTTTTAYAQYTGMYGGSAPSGIRGRQNLGENTGSAYDNWLNWFDNVGWSYGTADGNNYSFDSDQARAAYEAWVSSLSNSMPVPSYEEWLSWFTGKGSHYSETTGNTYWFVPVGDILPLLLLALLYFIVVSFKSLDTRKRIVVTSKE